MKIAIVCLNLTWQAGGVRLIYSQAHALERLGHRVTIYAPAVDETVYPELRRGLNVRVVPPPIPLDWQYVRPGLFGRIWEKLRRERAVRASARAIALAMDADFDIVNVHDFAYPVPYFYRSRNPRAALVWYMADPPYLYLPKTKVVYDLLSRVFNAWKDRRERKFYRAIHGVMVLVERNKRWVEERGMRAAITWSGIDYAHFAAPVRDLRHARPPVILAVGALNEYRRFEDVILAVARLRDDGRSVRCVIVCKNIWGADDYRKKLERLVSEKRLAGAVRLLFEGATEAELKTWYGTSHIFVMPIHLPPPRNGFGWQLTVFEAMAAGLPVVVSRRNDVIEALRDGATGLFVDPAAPDQIADKIALLLDDPALYARIARDGQEFVRHNMSWERFAGQLIELSRTDFKHATA